MVPRPHLDTVVRRLGGTRVVALPLIRILAALTGIAWVIVARASPGWEAVAVTVLLFSAYSVGVIAALWKWPGHVLRLNLAVLVIDVTFALLLVHWSGGAASALFLALFLIAGLQSYYYGIRRGVVVALGSAVAYVSVVVPTMTSADTADILIRVVTLLGTAVGVGVLADVEENERLQISSLRAIAHDRERFIRSVVESIRDGVVAVDAEGRVVAWSSVMEGRYGVTAAAATGRELFACLPAVHAALWHDQLRRLLAAEIEEFRIPAVEEPTSRGRIVQQLKAGLIRSPGGPGGAVIVFEDVTERAALERGARQAEKLAALGTLAAGLAHELNNPIGIISSRVELMLLEADGLGLPAEAREDLKVLHRHASRVARITQGLLSFARHSSGKQGNVDLNRLVEDALVLTERQMAKEGIRIVRALTPGLPPVWGDANALEQVLVNLLTNARDVLGAGGEITIESACIPEPPRVRLIVRDTGPGMTPEVLTRIFDPFFTTKEGGTGLGLSISYGIVRDHGGTVDVTSEPGQGTTFTLTFPALTGAA